MGVLHCNIITQLKGNWYQNILLTPLKVPQKVHPLYPDITKF